MCVRVFFTIKVRGALARVLDLQTEKYELMAKFRIHSDKEIDKQHDVVRVLKVQFLQICEKVSAIESWRQHARCEESDYMLVLLSRTFSILASFIFLNQGVGL